jgi:hypothetical protein
VSNFGQLRRNTGWFKADVLAPSASSIARIITDSIAKQACDGAQRRSLNTALWIHSQKRPSLPVDKIA